MKIKFDDPTVRNLETKSSAYECMADKEPGFGVRVHPSGTLTFFYQYKIDGKRRYLTLGNYPKLSLKSARELYQAELSKVKALRRGSADGVDPVVEKKRKQELRIAEETAHSQSKTISELCKEYIEKYASKFKRSWQEDERILNKEVIPLWGNRKAHDVKKRDIIVLVEAIVERGSPGMANNTFKIVRKMFNYAVEKDILQISAANGVKLPAPLNTRERVLSQDEIKLFWSNLETASISLDIQSVIKLILLTAQRPGEMVGIHTKEIDGDWWTIPSDRAKNGKSHRVFLTPSAKYIIEQSIVRVKANRKIAADANYDGFIFPCPHKAKDKSIDRHAISRAIAKNLAWPLTDVKGNQLYQKDGKPATENRLGIEHLTPHDLRRTAATFMAQSGAMDEVIDAVLNHAKQGVIKVYNQYRYDKEKQQTLEVWEQKLLIIISVK
ncbi:MAG: site-specific integrase [Desulfuromonadaceae bacterium]|jgi:integrase|nr:site-specific integrase [Desulfuromonadaceae bacterium]